MPSDRRLSQALSTVLTRLLPVLVICSAVTGTVCALEPLDALTAESSASYMDFGDGVTADVLTEDECFGAAPTTEGRRAVDKRIKRDLGESSVCLGCPDTLQTTYTAPIALRQRETNHPVQP